MPHWDKCKTSHATKKQSYPISGQDTFSMGGCSYSKFSIYTCGLEGMWLTAKNGMVVTLYLLRLNYIYLKHVYNL